MGGKESTMMKSFIVAISLGCSVFAQNPLSPKSERGEGVSIKFRADGIPGISIKTPANTANYADLVRNHLGREPRGIAKTQMRWSMLLANESGKQIVSLTLGSDLDGRRAYSFFGRFPFDPGRYIEPGQEVLLLTRAAIGKGENDPTAQQVGWDLPGTESALQEAQRALIWIDSVLFEDGSFFGQDQADSFTRLTSSVDTLTNIINACSGKSDEQAKSILEDMSRKLSGHTDLAHFHGPERALHAAWFAVSTGRLADFISREARILASVGTIHRGTQQ
jgi:hypothetical protein